MPDTRRFQLLVRHGGRSRSSRSLTQLDPTDLELLIDEFSLISSSTPQAWPEMFGRQLKHALRGLQLTPWQVAGLRTWMRHHNAYCGMRRRGNVSAIRSRVRLYCEQRAVRFGSEYQVLRQAQLIHPSGKDEYWATVMQEAFFYRCHEVAQGDRPVARTRPSLSLLPD